MYQLQGWKKRNNLLIHFLLSHLPRHLAAVEGPAVVCVKVPALLSVPAVMGAPIRAQIPVELTVHLRVPEAVTLQHPAAVLRAPVAVVHAPVDVYPGVQAVVQPAVGTVIQRVPTAVDQAVELVHAPGDVTKSVPAVALCVPVSVQTALVHAVGA